MDQFTDIETERTTLTIFTPNNAHLVLDYQLANKAHLSPWEPARSADYFSEQENSNRASKACEEFLSGTAIKLIAIDRVSRKVIACCNFTGIVKEPLLGCSLGYSLAKTFEGQGYMREIVRAGIDYMFEQVGLHRITACYMPKNVRSEKLLHKLGFEREGYAKSYLRIAGQWEDMVVCSLLNLDSSVDRLSVSVTC